MISKYNHKELNWIDLESPRIEEIEHILEQYPIPNNIKEKILSGYENDHVDVNYDYIYASLSGKYLFFVNDDFFLTIHKEPMRAFSEFSNEIELDVVGSEKINNHKLLFAYLLKNIQINNHKDLEDNHKDIESSFKQIENLKNILNKNKIKIQRQFYIIISLILLLIIFIWL